VAGDSTTVFGKIEQEMGALPPEYRNHGSLYEQRVPLVVGRANRTLPAANFFLHSRDLLRWLWAK